MISPALAARLDNPVHHALTGPHRHLAESSGEASRYPLDIGVFAAIGGETPDAWEDLATLLGAGGFGGLVRRSLGDVPAPLQVAAAFPCAQMVLETDADPAATADARHRVEPLGASDIDEMSALVERTDPGPFFGRTVELGGYLGVRTDAGELIAMAGRRMWLDGACEISAVCVDDAHRRKGLGAVVTRAVAAGIADDGLLPFLHVQAPNTGARDLYAAMGFIARAEVTVTVVAATS